VSDQTANLLPLFLKGDRLPALVIGGGEVALGKIEILLALGAQIKVVSKELHPRLIELYDAERFGWISKLFQSGDVRDCELVIAATDDRAVNRAVSDEAKQQHILVNVVDDPELCTVYFGATHRDGELVIALNSGGAAPFLSKELRDRLKVSSSGWGDWISWGAKFRDLVKRDIRDQVEREMLYRKFVAAGVRDGRDFAPPESISPEEWLRLWREQPSSGDGFCG